MVEFHVNIYIETSINGPGTREAAGKWLVEFVKENGIPVTRSGMAWRKKTTQNALTLELLRDALSILTKTCSIRVNTQCEHILSAVDNQWVPRWEKNGWANAKGKPVGNAGLWQQVYSMIRERYHFMEICTGAHRYQVEMQDDIRKEIRKRHGKCTANDV